MTFHLSTRIVWHDRGWDGHVCDHPAKNVYCTGQYSVGADFIRDNKDVDWEEAKAGNLCSDLYNGEQRIPPCMWTINAFSSEENPVGHVHPFIQRAKVMIEEYPPLAVGTWPYDQMYDMDTRKLKNLEERERGAKEFFDRFEPGKSLVFLYLNFDNPINSENKKYVLVGISRLVRFGPYNRFEGLNKYETSRYGDRLWSRYVVHGYPSEGVRIPYQEYLRLGKNVQSILLEVEGELDRRFKYVARDLSDDDACELIERMIAVIRRVEQDGFVKGDWQRDLSWLNKVLGETWVNRGPYPGLAGVLEALGVENSNLLVRRMVKEPKADLKEYVFDCLNSREEATWATSAVRKLWSQYADTTKGKLLHLLASFDLSGEQISKIVSERRESTGIASDLGEILDNPYILVEEYEGDNEDDVIGFFKIDNGIFPDKTIEPVIKMPPNDPRRVRALVLDRLKVEKGNGNCFLDLQTVLDDISEKRLDWRECNTSVEHIRAELGHYEKKGKLSLVEHEGKQFVYLQSIMEDERLVSTRIQNLLNKKYGPSGVDWRSSLRRPHPNIPDDTYEKVLTNQAESVESSFRNRLSVITGAAGTGKTTVVRELVNGIHATKPGTSFLLLTPTGKARERLHQATGKPAKTIHRVLMENKWLSKYSYRFKEGKKIEARNIIVDEASMVDLQLMAHLFKAIDWNYVERFVLVGDPNQLPPIGFGRPFFDIVSFLQSSLDHRSCISALTINCRQLVEQSTVLSLANIYTENPPPDYEILLNQIERGERFKDLEVVYWQNEKELEDKLYSQIEHVIVEAGIVSKEKPDELSQLLGIKLGFDRSSKSSGKFKVDTFQILSPYRGEYYGTWSINYWIQNEYRGAYLAKFRNLEGLTAADKVIQVVNATIGWTHELFNGQMGYVRFLDRENRRALVSLQEGLSESDVWFSRTEITPNLELGYAISVHKSQGSEFEVVFLVLPQEKMGLVSRELLYTALTRSRKKLVLFLQNSIVPLLRGMSAANSAIMLRNTSTFTFRFTSETYRVNDLIHRTARNDKVEYVRSKSEVIIANELLKHGISYEYENRLYSKDNSNWVLPDFTIQYEGETFYWEHLGRIADPTYSEHWDRKRKWYSENGYLPQLVTSDELRGFNSQEIVKLIETRIKGGSPAQLKST